MIPVPASPTAIDAGTPISHPAGSDPLLIPWLTATTEPEADLALARLLAEEAAPVFERIMRRKFSAPHRSPDAEDIISETRLQIVSRLQQFRQQKICDNFLPLSNFRGYVATVTYSAWVGHLRRRHPARAMLYNRVRYLLEGRAGSPRGFALWRGSAGQRLGGFTVWRDAGRDARPTPHERWLLVDAPAAAAEAFGGSARIPADLPALVAGLLTWLDGPLELRELVRVLAELLGVTSASDHSTTAWHEESDLAASDPAPSPQENLCWKEYLAWLWQEVCALPLRQRTAFLLHGSVLREMELSECASVRAAAAMLDLAPERMAELWPLLPLDDLRIAALLGGSRQQVINLRKVARATLGRAWEKWSSRTL